MRVAIVSPNPANNSGGVERFCHTLGEVIGRLGGVSSVVGVADLDKVPHDLAITNGMVSRRTTSPRIHVYHGCWVDHVRLGSRTNAYSLPWKTQFLLKGAAKEIWAGAHAYRVAVSAPTAAEVEHWYRLRVHRVIPNGIDTGTFAIGDRDVARKQLQVSADERLALFIGRAEARKRPDIAAAAASRAGYRLLTAGSGSVAGATSLGVLSPTELRTWIQAADCVLAPSDYEACSLAILEAMSTGTAVVTTRVGYVRTLVDQMPGYLDLTAPAGDLDEFTRALTLLPSRQAAVADATAYVRAENNLDRFAAHWSAAIDDVLARTRTVSG
ncbi:glycosyltransferase family 4 protein [Micromonospora sp. NPDC005806]|uniref:glycosyltransferase family 4 protein n=1 Tax=Micromonospora sp. NPDC005806 TaxID=3364234 RepID=UPI00368989AE